MKIKSYIKPTRIKFLEGELSKNEVLKEVLSLFEGNEMIHDFNSLSDAIFNREKILSTGIGFGIAIPHAKIEQVDDFVISIGIHRSGVDYESLDDKPVHIIVMIAGPSGRQKDYLSLLSRVLLVLKNKETRKHILECSEIKEIFDIFNQF